MRIQDIILKKANKNELNKEEIEFFIKEYCNNNITDYQASALVSAIYINSLSKKEIKYMTKYMVESGERLNFGDVFDKHSTGGVGDKVTIILIPILAALGFKFVKMSGRGLGYTGGTVDKFESIPNFNMTLNENQIFQGLINNNAVIVSQSENIALADKKIYYLRDAIGLTDSIPLIATSIMYKKIALGAKKLILEITYGSGAFMKTKSQAIKLKNIMLDIAKDYNINCYISITSMQEPLGLCVGNALEINESLDFLSTENVLERLKKDEAFKEIFLTILEMTKDIIKGFRREKIIEIIESKKALKKLEEIIKFQGGNLEKFKKDFEKYSNENILQYISKKSGKILKVDALSVAKAAFKSGSGRKNKEDKIDYFSGIKLLKKKNDYVKKGDIIAKIYTKKKSKDVEEIIRELDEAYEIK